MTEMNVTTTPSITTSSLNCLANGCDHIKKHKISYTIGTGAVLLTAIAATALIVWSKGRRTSSLQINNLPLNTANVQQASKLALTHGKVPTACIPDVPSNYLVGPNYLEQVHVNPKAFFKKEWINEYKRHWKHVNLDNLQWSNMRVDDIISKMRSNSKFKIIVDRDLGAMAIHYNKLLEHGNLALINHASRTLEAFLQAVERGYIK